MQLLATRRKKEAEEKSRAERATKEQAEEKEEEEECNSNKIQRSPLPQTEAEEQQSKQGDGDQESTPFRIKCIWEQENEGSQKKSKASKSSLDPITLTEGELDDIIDKVRDATTELLQQFEQQQRQVLVAIQMRLHKMQIQNTQLRLLQGRAA